jgi:hypothetical protein
LFWTFVVQNLYAYVVVSAVTLGGGGVGGMKGIDSAAGHGFDVDLFLEGRDENVLGPVFRGDWKPACRVGEHSVVAEFRRVHDCGTEDIIVSLVEWVLVVVTVFGVYVGW